MLDRHRVRLVTLLLVGFVAGAARVAAAQSPGLVAAYGFEEGGGAVVVDSSGRGNHGALGSALRVPGRFGAGLAFDGAGALVTVDDSTSLDLTTGMTLEAWVYPTRFASAWRDVVFKGPDDIYFLEGSSTAGGAPAGGGTFAANPLYAPGPLPLNTWSHLAATYDGSVIRLYVDGSPVASRAQGGLVSTSNGALTLGGDPLYGQYWEGRIDEVRIYDRALGAAEILTDMNTPVATLPPGGTPPTVAILSPAPGSTATHVTSVSAAASDDVGVLGVEFLVDGSSLGTDLDPPYVVGWNTTAGSGGVHTLTAVASDASGNQTTSAPVVVDVVNPGFVNEVVVPDITAATTIAFLPDGRMLVGELTERVWVVQPGMNAPDPVPFLQLDPSGLFGEQGLMDVLPAPGFAASQHYYVFYTRRFPGSNNRNRVSRFTASGNGTVAGSEVVLWQDDLVAEAEHHGGTLAFGADGMLYFTYGDQFIASNAQRLDTYRGKVLRVRPDGSVPTDNPFYDGAGPNKDAIWALGLRNPFRMSIDPAGGRMYIGDVGGNDAGTAIEEIDLGAPGANYGWPLCEGACGIPGVTGPVFSYPHLGRDASITGGVVYRGTQFPPEYRGSYFFGDYVQNTVRRLVFDTDGSVAAALDFWPADGSPDGALVGDPVKFVEGPDGSLYYVDIGFNDAHVPNPAAIRRIRYVATDSPPVVSAAATPTSGAAPLEVAFSSAGSFDPEGAPLAFLWTFGDGVSSTAPDPAHTYGVDGPYVARLRVSDGAQSTLSPDIAIEVGDPPTPTILAPADGSTFRAGDVIPFAGAASDPDEGALGEGALSWTVVFRHEGHVHPGAGPFVGVASGTFEIPTTGHDFQGDTRYEVTLSATDATGLRRSASVTVLPEKVDLAFRTDPSGLAVEINGIRKQTPFVLDELIGFEDTIHAPDQESGGTSYRFLGWSDGGAQSHTVVAPASDQTYVARFEATGPAGLVAGYSFDEGGGTAVADASGNGNAGTIGSAAWTTAGKHGGALVFDGASARVTVDDAPSLDLTTGMTLAAWVNPSTVGSVWRDVIFKGDDLYYLEATSPLGAPAMGGTFSASALYASTPLTPNTWTHLAGTYDGTAMRLYVNGVEVASRPQTGPIATSAHPLQIGGDGLYGQFFAGAIDEVRVYDRALSASEIGVVMDTPLGGPTGPGTRRLR